MAHSAFGMWKRLFRNPRQNIVRSAGTTSRVSQAGNQRAQRLDLSQSKSQATSNRPVLARFRNYLFGNTETQMGTIVVNSEESTMRLRRPAFDRPTQGTAKETKDISRADAKEVARPEEVIVQEEARLQRNFINWDRQAAENQKSRPSTWASIRNWFTGESQTSQNGTFVVRSGVSKQGPSVIRSQQRTPQRAKGKEKAQTHTNAQQVLRKEDARLQENFNKWDKETETLAKKHKQQQETLKKQVESRKKQLTVKQAFQSHVFQPFLVNAQLFLIQI